MVIISARLCYFFAVFSGFPSEAKAVTLFPFIFIRSKEDLVPWLITHEQIHIRQQLELLLLGAVLLHMVEMIYSVLILRLSWYESYLWSSTEQEAYRNQNNIEYLKQRKPFTQLYYVLHKKKFSHYNGVVTYF